ncbi:hypothetical protein ACLOJK_011055 [Asimina triloba]
MDVYFRWVSGRYPEYFETASNMLKPHNENRIYTESQQRDKTGGGTEVKGFQLICAVDNQSTVTDSTVRNFLPSEFVRHFSDFDRQPEDLLKLVRPPAKAESAGTHVNLGACERGRKAGVAHVGTSPCCDI